MSPEPTPAPKAYRCPYCERATTNGYRCENWDCGGDLAGRDLEVLKR